jgi:RHS repeat-associated protein
VSSAEACFDILGATRRGGATSYYLYDQLGSTGKLLDSSQAVTDSYSYFAFGDVRTSSGSTANPFKFVGRLGYYDDPSTEFQYLRARYYAPACGRFLARDPGRPRTGEYQYVGNRPVLRVDPWGLDDGPSYRFRDCFDACWHREYEECLAALGWTGMQDCFDYYASGCQGIVDPIDYIGCLYGVMAFCSALWGAVEATCRTKADAVCWAECWYEFCEPLMPTPRKLLPPGWGDWFHVTF